MIRLDKWIAEAARLSRSEAKSFIRAGRITINGHPVRSGEEKCDPKTDVLQLDGVRIGTLLPAHITLMLNKPAGVLSATEDRDQTTVLDLLPEEMRRRRALFPIGRLDKDTTGLLLISSDGDLAHRLMSPRTHVPKRYRAIVDNPLTKEDVAAFREGITLRDGLHCLPAELELPEEPSNPYLGIVTVYEGKYHQVRRMFASCGKHVTALHRQSIGSLELDQSLSPGQWRTVLDEELEKIFAGQEL